MVKLPRNFRPVINNHVYRSGNVDTAKPEELERWTNELGITTIVDFRSESEIAAQTKSFVPKFYPSSSPGEYLTVRAPGPTRIVMTIETAEFYKAVFKRGSFLIRIVSFLLVLWYMLTGKRDPLMKFGAHYILGREGLHLMYNILIDSSSRKLKEVFQVILKASRGGRLVISCTLGKDRTGVVCSLLQDLMGTPKEKIMEDFERSEVELQDIQESTTKWFLDRGFRESFAYAPGGEIGMTIDHIHRTYGGTIGFLHRIGLSEQEIEELKSNLSS